MEYLKAYPVEYIFRPLTHSENIYSIRTLWSGSFLDAWNTGCINKQNRWTSLPLWSWYSSTGRKNHNVPFFWGLLFFLRLTKPKTWILLVFCLLKFKQFHFSVFDHYNSLGGVHFIQPLPVSLKELPLQLFFGAYWQHLHRITKRKLIIPVYL